jgi:hypothetical protein
MGPGEASERFQNQARPSQEPDDAEAAAEGLVSEQREIVNNVEMR